MAKADVNQFLLEMRHLSVQVARGEGHYVGSPIQILCYKELEILGSTGVLYHRGELS